MLSRYLIILALMILAGSATIFSQQPRQESKPVLYVIGTSHLDSQWNWTVQDTIREFVPNTFFENFKRFEKYPDYRFNYEGAIHYMWFKEYHPEAWPTLQKYVADGRWKLAGSWINAVDVNVPSPESLMRQALYGKRFFRQEFGKVSQDVYLPDCFGFGFALPSIATHSGLSQFSTQKLTWGSSYGIPFPIGRWKGTDGTRRKPDGRRAGLLGRYRAWAVSRCPAAWSSRRYRPAVGALRDLRRPSQSPSGPPS